MALFSTNIAYAAASKDLNGFIINLNTLIINPLITFLLALAVVYFLYGVFEFIANGTNDEKKTVGKSHMLWGVVGITIMMGVWFILGLILNTFDITNIDPENGKVTLPDYDIPAS